MMRSPRGERRQELPSLNIALLMGSNPPQSGPHHYKDLTRLPRLMYVKAPARAGCCTISLTHSPTEEE